MAGILGKSALSLGRFYRTHVNLGLEGAFCAVVAFGVRVEDVVAFI